MVQEITNNPWISIGLKGGIAEEGVLAVQPESA